MIDSCAEKYLDGMNEEQREAATAIKGAVRLIAGAGSGKTFTLTRRVAYISKFKKIHPRRILSLTFTNKAAEEMRTRTASLMGLPAEDFYMSTFHSLALDIVKEHYKEVFGWSDFKIGNMSASMLVPKFFNNNILLFNNLSDSEIEELQKYLLKKVTRALNGKNYIDWMVDTSYHLPLAPLDELIEYMQKDEEVSKAYTNTKNNIKKTDDAIKIKNYCEEYKHKKTLRDSGGVPPYYSWVQAIIRQKVGICTFDDLINCALYILENYPEICSLWSNKFDYIQVDEFQDTDMKQLKIIQLLYKRHGNLFVVGDPDQSIYLFRGAEPSLFNNLDKYIDNLRTIFMITNYRSSDEIVKVSNKVIEMNKNRIPKTCVSKAGPKSKVEILFGDAGESLDRKEFKIIKNLLSSGVQPEEIAILYRSTGDVTTKDLQELLEADCIPFVTTLGCKDIYYDITYNLCRYSHSKDDTFLVNAAQYFEGNSNFGGGNLVDLSLFEKVSIDLDSIFSLFDKIKAKYKKAKGGILVPTAEYQRFLDAKSSILDSIKKALDSWSSLSKTEKDDSCIVNLLLTDAEPLDGKGIKIMTMHKSKGLEFPYVFVNGLSKSVMDKSMDDAEACEEKARIAYVAYSRAKTKLYLGCDSLTNMHGVLGKVCDMPIVDFEDDSQDFKDTVLVAQEQSISDYESLLDEKTKIVYSKLILESDNNVKGYRCTYSMHGEKYAFHAKLEDLERLNCVPNPTDFLVYVGEDIKIVKIKNGHFYAFDELNKAIKVIDLITDKDIKAVFMGSNNGYIKDIKDRDYLDTIVQDALSKQKKQDLKKSEETKEEKVSKKAISAPVLNISNLQKCKRELTYCLLLSKNKSEPIGVRIIREDKKYKDITIEEAKNKGLKPKDCKEKKFVPIYSDLNYIEFIELNKVNKQRQALKYKIIYVDLGNNKCTVINSELNTKQDLYIDDVVNSLRNGTVYISNPSALTSWRYWRK